MKKLNHLMYLAKYTAGSYADLFMSAPIAVSEKISDLAEKSLKEKTPDFLKKEQIREESPVYNCREKLRNSLDTRPGMLYLQSNIIGGVPFLLVGSAAAELTQLSIEKISPEINEIAKHTLNSSITFASQMAFGYITFMAAEIRANKEKYINDQGKLSAKKIGRGLINTAKTFLYFDVPYGVSKVFGQTFFLCQGKNPWAASALIDAIAFPAWWFGAAIPLGLKYGLIDVKKKTQS